MRIPSAFFVAAIASFLRAFVFIWINMVVFMQFYDKILIHPNFVTELKYTLLKVIKEIFLISLSVRCILRLHLAFIFISELKYT